MRPAQFTEICSTRFAIAFIALGLLIGCSTHKKRINYETSTPSAEATVPSAPANNPTTLTSPQPFVHAVRWQGECLSIIAEWYTGDSNNWKPIAYANPSIDRNLIRIGDMILVPNNILKTRDPLPESYVMRQNLNHSPNSPASKQLEENGDELELFSPR